MMRSSSSVALLLVLLCGSASCVDAASETFQIRPNRPREQIGVVAEEDENVNCVFSFTTVGGTNEQWVITLQSDGKSAYTCAIERPNQTSYLVFQQFQLDVTGMIKSAVVVDADGKDYPADGTFDLASSQQSLQSKGTFNGGVNKFVVSFAVKTEL